MTPIINKYEAISWNQLLVLGLVIIWGLRLTFNWASQWQGQKHEDWRYVEYRRTSGELFWAVELVGIELVPTTVVFLGCLSLYPVLTEVSPSFGFMQMAATALTLTAILLETTADFQLKRFLDQKLPPGSIMNKGLWKYSRHPNYLGEILFWWGLWLFIPGYGIIRWLALSGPLAVTALFVFVSIPLMEKHNLSRRSCYSQHAKKISVLIPWFPKND
jgi:steroid 5-alpha reductase family enzyme